ncbi:STAS domain-containing protein [Candidatus Mycobacterium wuenschmannii]|uniref:Anti-sigma factor antagonist n=1 Tax=Candidatus Mycobacterium wuenschmannii TaxID=3027808 RepID=A0ABY8W187_9MYCO|nr:STAS domain-containing protein [Candidatus Mycobacterium wuenschmannii]WIM88881.1 STAS domain-containing protein [Candidatus Mycobacterium wuenschmannii]
MPINTLDSSSRFAVLRRHENDVLIVSVRGGLDEVTAPSLATQLDESMIHQPRVLIVDLTAVHFMSTSGISLLVEMQRLTRSTSATLRVVADGPATSRPMHLLGVERLIELYPSMREAICGHRDGEARL